MQPAREDLGLRRVGAVGPPLRHELLEVLGRDVDLRRHPRPRPAQPRDLEGGDGHVGDRGARLQAARHRDHGDVVLARHARELAAARHDDAVGAEHPGRLVAGERLLGVARVRRAQHGGVRLRPGRQAVRARGEDRARGLIAERRLGERAADRGAAHARDDQAAGRVPLLESRGLDLPLRVAHVLGDREHVGEQVGCVDRLDGRAVEPQRPPRRQNLSAPSGSSTPGNTRAPRVTTFSAPIVTPSPSTAPFVICVRSPIRTPGPTMQSRRTQSAPISAPCSTTLRSTVLPRPDADPVAQHDEAPDVRALGDAHAAFDDRRRDDTTVDHRILGHREEAGPQSLCHRCRHVALDDVERALEIALRGPDVEPVGVRGEAEEAVADESRPDLALDRDRLVGRDEVEHAALEDVRAGGDEVRVDLVGGRLLEELLDARVVVQAHEAVGRRIRHRDEGERAGRARRLVLRDLRREVDVGEHVAVEHEEALLEQTLGVLQRAGGAARLGLLDETQPQAEGGAVAEDVAHARREEAAREDHVVHAVAAQPLEHVDDERPVHERNDGLGDGRGQRAKPGAFAPDQDHRLHGGVLTGGPRMPRCRARRPRTRVRPPGPRRHRGRCGRRRRGCPRMARGDVRPVELLELLPLGDEHDGVRVARPRRASRRRTATPGISRRASASATGRTRRPGRRRPAAGRSGRARTPRACRRCRA